MSVHLRRDVGLPPRGSAILMSRDHSRSLESYGSDLRFETNLVSSSIDHSEPISIPLHSSIGVIFADIRGFTTLVEKMAPADVMGLLQDFYGRMEVISLRHCGSVAVSTGDMLLITFGLAMAGDSDASNALACARDMLDQQKVWNLRRTTNGDLPIVFGIGVHYGPVISGIMGGERSTAFSVMGDTVNVANRLESLTRSLPTDLVMSAELINKVVQEASILRSDGTIDDLAFIGDQFLEGRIEGIDLYFLPKEESIRANQ